MTLCLAEVTLSLGDYGALGGMFATVVGIATTLLIVNIRGLGQRIDVIEHRVAKVEKCKADAADVLRLEDVQKDKADRRDWLRESVSTRLKVERVGEQVTALHSKLDAEFSMATVMAQLVGVAKELVEKKT